MSLKHDLPLLNALAVFETAARTSGFTAAARELGIAQSAVSRHVANVEAYFQITLFERHNKRLELTEAGRELADAIGAGLGHIRNVLTALRKEPESQVTLGCSHEFAYLWLMPRFARLEAEAGGQRLQLLTGNDYQMFDDDRTDLSIRFGQRPDWPDHVCNLLFREEGFAVCSPDYFERKRSIIERGPSAFGELRLLSSSQRGQRWSDWFEQAGVLPPCQNVPTFSSYLGVLQEAIAGHGVALAWRFLADDMLASGKLVRVSDHSMTSDSAYYIVHKAKAGSLTDRLAQFLVDSVNEPARKDGAEGG